MGVRRGEWKAEEEKKIRANWCRNHRSLQQNQCGRVWVGRPGFCYIALTVLKLEIQTRLALNSQKISLPLLPKLRKSVCATPRPGFVVLFLSWGGVVCLFRQGFLCIPACHGSHSVNHDGLKFRSSDCPCLPNAGTECMPLPPGLFLSFCHRISLCTHRLASNSRQSSFATVS